MTNVQDLEAEPIARSGNQIDHVYPDPDDALGRRGEGWKGDRVELGAKARPGPRSVDVIAEAGEEALLLHLASQIRTRGRLGDLRRLPGIGVPGEAADRAAAQLARSKPDLFNWAVSKDGHNHPHDFEHPNWKEDSEYF